MEPETGDGPTAKGLKRKRVDRPPEDRPSEMRPSEDRSPEERPSEERSPEPGDTDMRTRDRTGGSDTDPAPPPGETPQEVKGDISIGPSRPDDVADDS